MSGSTIKRIRIRKKFTQNDLAEWLGVSRQAVAMWELEKRELKISTIKKIAHVFNVPVEELLSPNNFPTKKESIMPNNTKTKTSQKSKPKKKIVFELMAPEAQKVRLTGDFNSWDNNGITMRRSKTGLWKTNVELTSGRYEYKFIVDNQWWTDPTNNDQAVNSFGDLNSVKNV